MQANLGFFGVLQPGKVVILLTGRYAGKKAVIVKNNDDGTSGRPYGHAIVAGLAKEPRKVRDSEGSPPISFTVRVCFGNVCSCTFGLCSALLASAPGL